MSNAVFPSLPGLKWDVSRSPAGRPRCSGRRRQGAARGVLVDADLQWQLSYELLRANALLELQTLIGFFNARQGKFDSFLFSDPTRQQA
jgi:hypothetical protein